MTQIHDEDRVGFTSVLPDEVDWQPFPAFPPSARLAVVVGEPWIGPLGSEYLDPKDEPEAAKPMVEVLVGSRAGAPLIARPATPAPVTRGVRGAMDRGWRDRPKDSLF